MIDNKYTIYAVNNLTGEIHTSEDSVLFLAKDKAVLDMLVQYQNICAKLGSPLSHIHAVVGLRNRVYDWQRDNPNKVKVPDTYSACSKRTGVKDPNGIATIQDKLLQTMDGMEWAREFVKTYYCNRSIASDVAKMNAWFANAIMVGYDRGYNKAKEETTTDSVDGCDRPQDVDRNVGFNIGKADNDINTAKGQQILRDAAMKDEQVQSLFENSQQYKVYPANKEGYEAVIGSFKETDRYVYDKQESENRLKNQRIIDHSHQTIFDAFWQTNMLLSRKWIYDTATKAVVALAEKGLLVDEGLLVDVSKEVHALRTELRVCKESRLDLIDGQKHMQYDILHLQKERDGLKHTVDEQAKVIQRECTKTEEANKRSMEHAEYADNYRREVRRLNIAFADARGTEGIYREENWKQKDQIKELGLKLRDAEQLLEQYRETHDKQHKLIKEQDCPAAYRLIEEYEGRFEDQQVLMKQASEKIEELESMLDNCEKVALMRQEKLNRYERVSLGDKEVVICTTEEPPAVVAYLDWYERNDLKRQRRFKEHHLRAAYLNGWNAHSKYPFSQSREAGREEIKLTVKTVQDAAEKEYTLYRSVNKDLFACALVEELLKKFSIRIK